MDKRLHQRLFSRKGIAGLTAGLALAGLSAGGLAFAQTPSPTAEPAGNTFIQRLAQRLGIGEDQLTQAVHDTRSAMIDEAVAQGRVTPEQAERMKNRDLKGRLGPGLFGGGRGPGEHSAGGPRQFIRAEFASIAQWLGLDAATLRSELQSGKSLAEVAQAQGQDRTALVNKLTTDITGQINQAVQSGRLTQEQADRILPNVQSHVERMVDRQHGAGMGHGMRQEQR